MKNLYVSNVLMDRFTVWMCVAIVAVSVVDFAEAALPAQQYVEPVPFTVYIQDGSFKDEDTFNDSDVYGRINFPGHSSRYTQVVNNDNTPYFNRTFNYNYNIATYGYPDTIRFDFWDDDDGGLGGNDDYLGVEYVNFNLGVYPYTNARGSLTRYYFNNQWFDARITAQSMKVKLDNNENWNVGTSLSLGTNRQFQRVTVNSGGHLTVPGTLSFANSAGVVTLNAGGEVAVNALSHTTGAFNWNGGKLRFMQNQTISNTNPYNLPNANITAGRTLQFDGTLNINGAGKLTIAGGSLVTKQNITVNGGQLLVNGGGFSIAANKQVRVMNNGQFAIAFTASFNGNTSFLLESGGDATTHKLNIGAPTGPGSLSMTGAGTTLTQAGASALTVGSVNAGNGTVKVSNNAVFTGGTGQVTINNKGKIDVNGGTFHANSHVVSAGELVVSAGVFNAGGKTVGNNGTAGWQLSTTGDVTLSGAGRVDMLGGNAFGNSSGVSGAGGKVIANGGSVALSATSQLRLSGGTGARGDLLADGTPGGAGGRLEINGGNVTGGDSSKILLNGGRGGLGDVASLAGRGGNAGQLNMTSGSLVLNGSTQLNLNGGSGGVASTSADGGGDGGQGGELNIDSAIVQVLGNSSVQLNGGNGSTIPDPGFFGGFGGDGGDGGVVRVKPGAILTVDGGSLTTNRGGRGNGPSGPGTYGQYGNIHQTGGAINLNNGLISTGVFQQSGGSFGFNGGVLNIDHFDGNLVNNGGTLSPGHSPGVTTVSGNYAHNLGSALLMELKGTDNANPTAIQYDQLHVNGQLGLAGNLTVQLIGGFAPGMGDNFDLLDWGSLLGTFNTLNLPALGGGLAWDTGSLYDDGVLGVTLLGDINGDGLVNGFDVDPFVDMLLNGPYNPVGDMNNDGAINGFDVDPFVAAVLGGGPVPITSDIPEPATFALLGLGLVGLRRRARR